MKDAKMAIKWSMHPLNCRLLNCLREGIEPLDQLSMEEKCNRQAQLRKIGLLDSANVPIEGNIAALRTLIDSLATSSVNCDMLDPNCEVKLEAYLSLRALENPIRKKIIAVIRIYGSCESGTIYNTDTTLEQSETSLHTKILQDAGYLYKERNGKFTYCSLDEYAIERDKNHVETWKSKVK